LFHAFPHGVERVSAISEADSERTLKRLFALATHLPSRARISAAVTEGDAFAEILRHARLMKADLIAIGMHSQDGSVSPLVVRLAIDAPCPVLAVDGTLTVPMKASGLAHMLVAVNFLPASRSAVDYASALAQTVAAKVTVVHVVPEDWDGQRRNDAIVNETHQPVEPLFRQLVQITAGGGSGTGPNPRKLLTAGRPCVEIVRIATASHADLIVMGIDARSKSAPEFGETTSCVMQFAHKTVLLVPEQLFQAPWAGDSDPGNRPD
jgi:nucleotide-binding universal stress UspA family protein